MRNQDPRPPPPDPEHGSDIIIGVFPCNRLDRLTKNSATETILASKTIIWKPGFTVNLLRLVLRLH